MMNDSGFYKRKVNLKSVIDVTIKILICYVLSNLVVYDFIVDFPEYAFGVTLGWTVAFFLILKFGKTNGQDAKVNRIHGIFDIKKYSALYITSIIAISAVITCTFKTGVNQIIDIMLPTKTVEISIIQPGEVRFLDDGGNMSLFDNLSNGEVKGNWTYGGNIIVTLDDFSYVKLSAKERYNSYISFVRILNGATIDVSSENYHQSVNLDCGNAAESVINVYPFKKNPMQLVYKCLLYILIFSFVFCGLIVVVQFLNNLECDKRVFLLQDYNDKFWWMIFAFMYPYSIFQSSIGVSYYGEYGDQEYYWISLVNDGRLSFKDISTWIFAPRGYWGNVFPTISKLIGQLMHIKPVYVFLFFSSLALSILFGNYLPQIYFLISKTKPRVLSVVTSVVLFVMFWNGMLSSVLSDVFAVFFFVGAGLYLLKFVYSYKIGYAFLTGIYSYIACSYRMTYLTALLGEMCIVALMFFVYRKQINKSKLKNYLLGTFLVLIAFLLTSLPQAQINYYKNHFGILPYDYEGSWPAPDIYDDTSLTLYGANYTLRQSYIWYPFQESDAQQLSMKTQLYNNVNEYLSFPQILDVYASSPMDTVVFLIKKFFIAFDEKTSHVYPLGEIQWRESRGILFSLENYTVVGIAIFLMFFAGEDKKKERGIFLFMLAFIAFPQMFTHIEWRYFLPLYLWCYYMVSYHFIPGILIDDEKPYINQSSKLYPILATYLIAAFVINFSISA